MAVITYIRFTETFQPKSKMFIADRAKLLYKLFQFVGLAPINTTKKDRKINIINVIPAVLTTIIGLSIAAFLFIHPHFASFGSIHIIINFASLCSLTLVLLTGNGQSFFRKFVHRKMNNKITQIEQNIFAGVPIKSPFVNAYKLKTFSVFFLFFLSQGIVLYESSLISYASIPPAIFTSTFRLICPVAVSHVVLYCDTVSNLLYCLNVKMGNSSTCVYENSSKIELLKNIKLMHMELWKVVVQINRYFGWNLMFLVINSFVYITYQLYWIFVTLDKYWDLLGVIGWEIILFDLTFCTEPFYIYIEHISEGGFSLLYGVTSLYVLVTSCESCSLEVQIVLRVIEVDFC